ncbi:MBOAT family O-acyltransferase [Nannocystis pusilla]|uniref:MBOAT family O-acyltransferase n=1 Tax=Nannocystis pusilla TaxID=889268 RepID=UPI003BF16C5A
MLFVSFDFLLFIVPVLLISWGLSHVPVMRVLFLIAASYFFYMAGPETDPLQPPWYFVGLLALSTVLDYVCSRQIWQQRAAFDSKDPRTKASAARVRNFWLGVSLVGNLGLLGYFKYTNFFLGVFSDVAHALGMSVVVPHLELLLPIGISFYTFQTLSYTIDVWRGRLTPEPSFRKFALFVVFFPQLVAGPIVRAHEFLPQLHRPPRLSAETMTRGMYRVMIGVAKKAILGDWIASQFTDAVFNAPENYTSLEILLSLYAFTLQLYADFSGYTDIAIGVALMLGFVLPENFERPYQAKNLGEFWRRWHMTLSTWLRDYVFFPLGGSKGSPGRVYFNLWLTMFLVGMWHGASWNFILYSNIHALAMVFNRWNRLRKRGTGTAKTRAMWVTGMLLLFGAVYGLSTAVLQLGQPESLGLAGFAVLMFLIVARLPETGTAWNTALHVLLTFHFTVLSRVFFRADDLDTSRKMIAGLLRFDTHGIREGLITPAVWTVLLFGIGYHLLTPKGLVDRETYAVFRRLPGPLIGLLLAALGLAVHLLLSSGPRANIYFQF